MDGILIDDTYYPKSFRMRAKGIGVKKTFVTDVPITSDYDCPNCGGVGSMTLFCASKGPYQSPWGPGSKDKDGEFMSNRWDGSAWWVGTNYSDECPVCDGLGQAKEIVPFSRNTDRQISRVVKELE